MRLLIALAFCCAGYAPAHAHAQQTPDLADLSLEQLSDIVVTSVSRRQERLGDAPASVFVIGNDDIRRAGATNVPEALRIAPNLQVARINGGQYTVAARGGNTATSNKLLVLIDGRAVYTPLYAGVFWDVQRVLLEDVDRIEVISGPGATLWGANAVNGVINIITRHARETQGMLVEARAGDLDDGYSARYGGALGQHGHYRVYAKRALRGESHYASGAAVADRGRIGQVGMRADWTVGADTYTLQGDVYDGFMEQLPQGRSVGGANLLARWGRTFAD
ncbi:MAG TPA: TonB-dependent receptor plug domain-containing protein, partial [Burkholderiaceae bacterium]